MRPPRTVRGAEAFGRIRLSRSFFMRDFLHSEIASIHGFANLPDDNLNCASNARDFARHIWDRRDADGIGAMACIVVPWLVDRIATGTSWIAMAWWIHDHLPYSELQFFPKLCAFNIAWHEVPRRTIYSFVAPRGYLTRPGFSNHAGNHSPLYEGFPRPAGYTS